MDHNHPEIDDELIRGGPEDERINDIEIDVDEIQEVVGTEGSDARSKAKGKRPATEASVSVSDDAKNSKLLKSDVWQYYEVHPKDSQGKHYYSCKKCGKRYRCESTYGTTNLKRHRSNCVLRTNKDLGQMMLLAEKSTMALVNNDFDPLKLRDLISAAIVKRNLSFKWVEHEEIRAIFQYLKPDLRLISRNTARSDVMKMYVSLKGKIRALLASSRSKICLTPDMWTSVTTDGYISLTAHFVDNDWSLRKVLLGFSHLLPPHSGRALAEKIYDMLKDWGILHKVFSLTLDNASANDVSVDQLKDKLLQNHPLVLDGQFLHVRCCAHMLNLIVQDGLKKADGAVKKIREIVRHIRNSQIRKTDFIKNVKDFQLDGRIGLRQDCPTRWNSTFLMLQSAIHYKKAIRFMDLGNSMECPSSDEWVKIEAITDFLGAIFDLTCLFSGTKYPTANLYFPLVSEINYSLNKDYEGDNSFMRSMVEQMKIKFDKYWSNFSIILATAIILDPRYKFEFIEFAFKELFGNDRGHTEAMVIHNKLFQLYDDYVSKSSLTLPTSSESSIGRNRRYVIGRNNTSYAGHQILRHSKEGGFLMDRFDDISIPEQANQSELERYLEETRSKRNVPVDVLNYWKGESSRAPILSAMACDIFSIPITTVASESTFSEGGRVLDQYRSSLKPDIVEAIMCCKSWVGCKEDEETTMEQDNDVVFTPEAAAEVEVVEQGSVG